MPSRSGGLGRASQVKAMSAPLTRDAVSRTLGSTGRRPVGFGGSPKRTFPERLVFEEIGALLKFAMAGRHRQHASRVRSPEAMSAPLTRDAVSRILGSTGRRPVVLAARQNELSLSRAIVWNPSSRWRAAIASTRAACAPRSCRDALLHFASTTDAIWHAARLDAALIHRFGEGRRHDEFASIAGFDLEGNRAHGAADRGEKDGSIFPHLDVIAAGLIDAGPERAFDDFESAREQIGDGDVADASRGRWRGRADER